MAIRKINILSLFLLLMLLNISEFLMAQRRLGENERQTIATNVDALLSSYTRSLIFEINIPQNTQQIIRQQIEVLADSLVAVNTDSIYALKIDSALQLERNRVVENMLQHFRESTRSGESHSVNFVFDTLIYPQESFTVKDFAQKFTTLYSKVTGDVRVNYVFGNDTISNLRQYMNQADIERFDGGFRVDVPFIFGWLQGTYDTTQAVRQLRPKVEEGDKPAEFFSTSALGKRNIGLTATIFFEKVENANSYKILSIGDYKSGTKWQDLQSFLNEGILEDLSSHGKLNYSGIKIDTLSNVIPLFLNVFDDVEKDALECALFFSDTVCQEFGAGNQGRINISPLKFVELAKKNYWYISRFSIEMINEKIEVIDGKDILLAKWPAWIHFTPRDFDDKVPDGLGKKTLANLYFLVEKEKQHIFSKGKSMKFHRARITDIATYDKTVILKQPVKKGNLSFAVAYSPMLCLFQIDRASAFEVYQNIFKISHGIGAELGYFWPGRKQGEFYGLSTGLSYEKMNSRMFMDSTFYSIHLTGSAIPIGSDNINYYEERVWAVDFEQSLKYDLFSIPLMFNYITTMQSKSLFELGIGIKFSFLNQNSISLSQTNGHSTHKGWYEVTFPDESSGGYLLENLPEYNYVNNMPVTKIDQSNSENNNMVISLALKPSISIPIEEYVKNGHLQLGMMFQYGFNSIYKTNENERLLVEMPGSSNNVFSNGVGKNNFLVGFVIGFRYFDSNIHRADRAFRF
jgi:hypothetical protein